ncbi:hypothetical protein SASPL_132612 [Salvia splendens]|uniref:Myb/SANT-like domain-containing protein n=1 Tax=Salvia splendens TaxID=180675 RepID=A0A8X8ZHC4_SALSN|nr:hypothetical protein SASPL_132612 [Salvia splendens]
MELRRAGLNALNAGRYYLKCPHNEKHPMSFEWYDEYRSHNKWYTKEATGKRIREGKRTAIRDHRYSKGSRAQSQRQLEQKQSVFFSEAELSQCVEHLQKCYKTFKVVVHTNVAYWDMENKYVRASDDLWHKIIKKNEFAGAYYYHDEHMYSSLACLFGMDDVKVEEEMEVIDISDNTEKIMSEDTMPVDLEEDDEEVNSPAVFRRPKEDTITFIIVLYDAMSK